MEKFTQVLKDFWNDEEGLTAVEYAVAGGIITAALVAGFSAIGTKASALLKDLVAAIGGDTTGL
ncbi:Flp family type IVb pilin [Vibrio alfacsensis]|uniref:Flp family type IVb pilin n=1 Tax=Vibrio alfacsensis TaxID=1074311 RepID=UPI0040693DBD